MKTIVIATFLSVVSLLLTAQINTTLSRNYGGPGYDNITRFYQSGDGGFFWCGNTTMAGGDIPENFGSADGWFMKVDANGDSVHSAVAGGSDMDFITDVMEYSSPDYVFLLTSASTDNGFSGGHGSFDVWIKGYDPASGLSSGLPFGGSASDFGNRITPKNAGGFIVTGNSSSSDGNLPGNYGSGDIWVLCLQSNLSVVWSKNFGGSGLDRGIVSYQLTNGDIMVFGNTQSSDHDIHNQHGMTDVFVVKLNSIGDTLWTRTYGGTADDFINDVKFINDSTFVMIGSSNSTNGDFMFRDRIATFFGFYYVVDENGNYISCGSQNTLDNEHLYFSDVIFENPNSALAFGVTYSDSIHNCTTPSHGSTEVCVVDFNGITAITPYLLGGNDVDGQNNDLEYYVRAVKTGTNQYALCTNSNSTDLSPDYHGQCDVWLSIIEVQHQSIPEAEQLQLSVYPNPAENLIVVDTENSGENAQYEVFDLQGKLLLHGEYEASGINISLLENGLYLLKIQSGDSSGIARFVKQ